MLTIYSFRVPLIADGSYEYSSFKNYAHLEDNGDFTVYDALGTPSE